MIADTHHHHTGAVPQGVAWRGVARRGALHRQLCASAPLPTNTHAVSADILDTHTRTVKVTPLR